MEGSLLLDHLNGNFSNIRNYNFRPQDSLSFAFNGRFLDTAAFHLRVDESYTDPLFGFLMTLTIKPASLTILNPLLAPLSNIKFTSGKIDSFYMTAAGNENLARGNMTFYYHGLHLQIIKAGQISETSFLKLVESGLVNAFVLKTNNRDRNGLIYFKRLKDRSFFNYMNKIIFSGVATSVGAKKNNRYRKDFINDAEEEKKDGK
ncbi:MAG: hypothetical protein M3015_10120 [Bacteroidota bacterium]|nr:hypothetical protein [Bacteroidota bacterium]